MDDVNKNMDSKNHIIKDDKIDLIEVTKTIWIGRKQILKIIAVLFVFSLVIAFGSKVEYEASSTLMPESQEGMNPNLGGLGNLAGLAGINLDMGTTGVLTPELYPEITKSTPFLIEVWNQPIPFESKDTVISSYIYLRDIDKPSLIDGIVKYTFGLPFQIKNWLTKKEINYSSNTISNESIIRLSERDALLLKNFKKRLTVKVDAKTGIFSLSAEMPDPTAAAYLTQVSIDILTKHIADYKVNKAMVNYKFVNERYIEAKTNFEDVQLQLALFDDRNKNVVTARAQTELQKLQNKFNISYEIYKGLATQLEQAKLKVKQDTPVFTVLEPVKIPIKKSSPKRVALLISSIIIGFLVGIGFIFIKKSLQKMYIQSDTTIL